MVKFMTTRIDPDLLAIYKKSDYRVHDPAGVDFVMHIEEYCPALHRLMQREKVRMSGFVSAYNPRSEPRSDLENTMAQERLRQEVMMRGWKFLEGVGEDPGGECAGEPCLLILDISFSDCEALGRSYGQNAVLWSEADAIPRLLLLH